MASVWQRIKEEPAGAISIVGAFMALLVLFGVPLSDNQQAGVTSFLFLVVGYLTRQAVTPNVKVDAKVDAEVEKALTAEAEPMTDEQRQLVDDLKAIIARLNEVDSPEFAASVRSHLRDPITAANLARDRAERRRG